MSKFTRRDLIHAGCTIAAASLVPSLLDQAEAGLRLHGSASSATSSLSKRNIINLQQFSIGTTDYALIDHIRYGTTGSGGPFNSDWNPSGAPTFPSVIDANGYVNQTSGSGKRNGGGFYVPDTSNFAGPYTLDILGSGAIDLIVQTPDAATFTASGATNCSVTFNSGGAFQVTSTATGSTRASIQITLSFPTQVGPRAVQWFVQSTGSAGANFISSVRFYRTADATDLAAGKIFRAPWKQLLVNLDPSAIRWMNNIGGNQDNNCRFENRTLPTDICYSNHSQWNKSPSYSTNVTGTNQFVCAAATPTTSNPKNTPASMQHGEIATMRFTNGFARPGGNSLRVSSITNANPGVVTTTSAHGFNTGDIVAHYFNGQFGLAGTLNGTTTITSIASSITSAMIGMFLFGSGIPANTTITNVVGSTVTISNAATISGTTPLAAFSMKNLHQFPCTITVIDSTHYSLGIDTTNFGSFVDTSNHTNPYQFVSLQVGSGNDRVAYPMTQLDGNTPANYNGATYLNANDYKTFFFDKTVSAQTDGAGNAIMGCWIGEANVNNNSNGFSGDAPIEIAVALCNELNAMSPAHTIGVWMNIPVMGLSSMDPDHTAASDWAVNAVDVVMNPNSTVRTSGYSALGYSGSTKLNSPVLVLEYSNELWLSQTNNGGVGYLQNRSIQRWNNYVPAAPAPNYSIGSEWIDLKSLRSTCWTRDVAASNPPNSSQIVTALGLQGFGGFGTTSQNYLTAYGGQVEPSNIPIKVGDWYTNDPLVTAGGWGTPISNHGGVCPATYFDAPNSYYNTASGTGMFTDDSAMYNGYDNSGTLSMTGGASSATISATFTAGAPDIAATNTLVAGQAIKFTTTVGNISSATTYYVSPYQLSSSSFRVATSPLNNPTWTAPNTNGSSTATPSALTITAVAAGTPVVLQPLVGTGIAAGTYVLGVTGSSPNYTLALSQPNTVAGGATITSPSNGGGNYIGAANQSQALANFVAKVVDVTNTGGGQSTTVYGTVLLPQYAAGLPVGKVVLGYEGGTAWSTAAGANAGGSHILTFADQALLLAAINNSQWATAQTNFFSTVNSDAGCYMPALYLWIQGSIGNQRYGYATPDSYATISGTPTEGAALTVNSPVWIAMSAANQAQSN